MYVYIALEISSSPHENEKLVETQWFVNEVPGHTKQIFIYGFLAFYCSA